MSTLNDRGTPGAEQPRRTGWWAALLVVLLLLVGGYCTLTNNIEGWQKGSPKAPAPVITVLPPAPSHAASGATAVAPAASAPAPAASVPAPAPQQAGAGEDTDQGDSIEFYTVRRGDQLGRLWTHDWKEVCELNKLADCNHIETHQVLKHRAATMPNVKSEATPAAKPVVVTTAPRVVLPKKEVSCITLGAAPFNPEHNLARTLEGIDLLQTLPADKKEIAKRKVLLGEKLAENQLVGDQVFGEMLYKSRVTGKVMHVYDKPICSPEEGGVPEVTDTYDLGDGYIFADPRRCGNPSWYIHRVEKQELIAPPPHIAEQPDEPEPPAPALADLGPEEEHEVVLTSVEDEDVRAYEDDWDLGFYAGGDRDVRYAGGEGAYYPVLSHRAWGRLALGVGAFANFWDGSNPQDYHYGGRYGAIGFAQKWSTYERRDLGIKFPMIGALDLHGRDGTGAYREHRDARLLCAALSFTDASREKAGEKKFTEWQIWTSFCNPISQSKSHSWLGQPIDNAQMEDIRYIVSAGARVYPTKDLTGLVGEESTIAKKLQPFVELGANKTSPFPYSAHLYGGLRTVDKVWGCGIGPHYSSAGTIPGVTCTYDYGRHYKLRVQQGRWDATVQSLRALGVAIDEE